jgi:hypothetical protein
MDQILDCIKKLERFKLEFFLENPTLPATLAEKKIKEKANELIGVSDVYYMDLHAK